MAICLLLSLLLHVAMALLLAEMRLDKRPAPSPQPQGRVIRVQRKQHLASTEEKKEGEKEDKATPFAKTSPDQAEKRPERKDFVGKRNSRAAYDPEAGYLEGDKDTPAITGEKKDELVSFDQEKQEGELEHDGKEQPSPDTAPVVPLPPILAETTIPPSPEGVGEPHAAPANEWEGTDKDSTPESAVTHSLTTVPSTPQGEMKLTPPDIREIAEQAPRFPEITQPTGDSGHTPQPFPPGVEARVYRDPSLADHAQPGFRTQERRSRSTGRFVMGRHAALNVAATPTGRYQEEIYRRIAYWWYRACDDHRGDIIPGKIVISLRLNNKGRLVNMDLVQRSGASVIQQSFTFGAIRQASLPSMPLAVQEEMVGELMELIFEFNFD